MKVEERVAHTPGKWKVDTKRTNRYGGFSITADGSRPNSLCVADTRDMAGHGDALANSNRIVTACNAHEALVDALRAAIELPKRMRDACHKDMMRVIELCMLDLPEGDAKEAVRILGASVGDTVEGFGDTDEKELIAARAALSQAGAK